MTHAHEATAIGRSRGGIGSGDLQRATYTQTQTPNPRPSLPTRRARPRAVPSLQRKSASVAAAASPITAYRGSPRASGRTAPGLSPLRRADSWLQISHCQGTEALFPIFLYCFLLWSPENFGEQLKRSGLLACRLEE